MNALENKPTKLYIFDLDNTLIYERNHQPTLMDDTITILEFIKNNTQNNSIITLATHNWDARNIVKQLGIANYFSVIDCTYDFSCKVSNVNRIRALYPTIKLENITFYDDLPENVDAIRLLGIRSVLASWTMGLTFKAFTLLEL